MRQITTVLILLLLIFSGSAAAEDALPINGFVQLNYSARITEDDDYILAEERLQLEIAKDVYDPVNAAFFVKVDFVKDELHDEEFDSGDSTTTEIREAYVTLSFDSFDLKIGRQITTWGVGDLLFINDAFPKDWTSLLSGRPLQYLKIGAASIKIGMYSDLFDTDLIITPHFEEDVLPDGRKLYYYAPPPPPGITSTEKVLPDEEASNPELSLKVSKYIGETDISLYAHRTFWREPHARVNGTTMEIFYPRLDIYGATVQRSIGGWMAKFEGGYYQSRRDESGSDPLIKNSETRYLIALEKELFTDFNFSYQYYVEAMNNHERYEATLPAGSVKRDERRRVSAVRLTIYMLHQTLTMSLYTQLGHTDEDYFVNPELKYMITDNLYAAIGANVFGGTDDYTMFGQYDSNDNVYTQMRYSF